MIKNDFKHTFVTDLTDVKTTDVEGVGSIRIDRYGKRYRWVQNSTTADCAIGDVVYSGTGSLQTLGYDAQIFQLGQTNGGTLASSMAGVVMGVITAGNYGWIQTWGRCAQVNVDGTTDVVIGDSLKGSSGHSWAIHDTAAGTAPTLSRNIIALAGFTTDSTQSLIAGDIRCS